MIRLIALDIDGTLVDRNSQVPDANRRAIASATSLGVEVALVTGRRFDFTCAIVDQLEGPLTLIVNNGALVKTRDGSTLSTSLLPAGVARAVLEATRAYRSHAALVFDRARQGQVVHERVDTPDPLMQRYFDRNREFVRETTPLEEALTEDPIQIMFAGPLAEMRELEERLRSDPFAGQYSVAVTEYEDRNLSLVDVIQRGCSKGAALAAWATRQGITRDEVMAVGDNLNDREMLEFAGLPVVMGNSVPALKSIGWIETLTNDEAGVAAAIERFVLAERAGITTPGGTQLGA
jgi:Cof subfamily protein (haloacid dehalogenase superfamily)